MGKFSKIRRTAKMAFQGIFMMRTAVIIPSRGFASLASKQTLVFKNGLPPAPSQIRHISIKNPKLGGSWGGVGFWRSRWFWFGNA